MFHSEIRKGSPRARALNETGVGKIRHFQPITRRISETRGRQSEYSKQKWRFSTSRRENISQTVSNAATVTISHQ